MSAQMSRLQGLGVRLSGDSVSQGESGLGLLAIKTAPPRCCGSHSPLPREEVKHPLTFS